ncbi:transcriptional regulator, TetR family [Bradyrhizobiaceae bacterium SG-6C]|nr:transcriptional regulator, TetR family [Bradyrhizobiaceae bacterium SG-6C]
MDDIIRQSGLSAGAVYSYFKNKDDLIVLAVTTSMTGLAEVLAPLLAAEKLLPPAELLAAITTAISGFTARDGFDLKRIAILGWGEAQRNPQVSTALRDSYAAFREHLTQAARIWKQRGEIDANADPADIAKTLLAAALGFVAQSAILGEVEPAMLERGLTAFRAPATAT